MRIHSLENVDKALQFLKEQRVHLENVGSHDIVDGNHRLTLGLVWTIILRFQVIPHDLLPHPQPAAHRRALGEHPTHSLLPLPNFPPIFQELSNQVVVMKTMIKISCDCPYCCNHIYTVCTYFRTLF